MRVCLVAGFLSQLVMITLSVVGVHLAEPHVAYGVVWAGQARAQRGREQRRGVGGCGACVWQRGDVAPALRRWWAPSASRCS